MAILQYPCCGSTDIKSDKKKQHLQVESSTGLNVSHVENLSLYALNVETLLTLTT